MSVDLHTHQFRKRIQVDPKKKETQLKLRAENQKKIKIKR